MTKKGRTEMLFATPLLLLAVISFLIFAFEQTKNWIVAFVASIGLPENFRLPICYGIIILGVLGVFAIIYPFVKQDIRNFIQNLRSQIYQDRNSESLPKKPINKSQRKERLPKLVPLLDESFDEEELKMVCFDLGVEYDNLRGQGKVNKARELVKYLERQNRTHELLSLVKDKRPNIIWRRFF